MPNPILTLTTDFGVSDHYVGVMKGVILGICPEAQIVDVTHDVPAFQIHDGAFTIAQAYPYFPARTVHVVVVDPGVGTSRRPILVQAAGQYFIAPDNGVLSMVYSREKHNVRAITNEKYFLPTVSQTFHGRDVFAPVAAHLAAGVAPSRVGKLIVDYVRPLQRPQSAGQNSWSGSIFKIDHFGNIITDFHAADFPGLEHRKIALNIGLRRITALAHNYAEFSEGELFVIVGSSGYLEVSVSQGSAASLIGAEPGASIILEME